MYRASDFETKDVAGERAADAFDIGVGRGRRAAGGGRASRSLRGVVILTCGSCLLFILPTAPSVRLFPSCYILELYIYLWCRAPSAKTRPFRRSKYCPPASVDRFPCFHTCPAYEQKKRANPGRIFLNAIYIPSARNLLVCYRPLASQLCLLFFCDS